MRSIFYNVKYLIILIVANLLLYVVLIIPAVIYGIVLGIIKLVQFVYGLINLQKFRKWRK